jgi:hypothetical protein
LLTGDVGNAQFMFRERACKANFIVTAGMTQAGARFWAPEVKLQLGVSTGIVRLRFCSSRRRYLMASVNGAVCVEVPLVPLTVTV